MVEAHGLIIDELVIGSDITIDGDFVANGIVTTPSSETITASGVVSIETALTLIVDSGGDPQQNSLADGVEGQEKFIILKTYDAGVRVVPVNFHNGTYMNFGAAGICAHLKFMNGGWAYMGGTATLV